MIRCLPLEHLGHHPHRAARLREDAEGGAGKAIGSRGTGRGSMRVGMSGVEIEGRISSTVGNALLVKVKATQLRAHPKRRTRSA
jgi:hypothetical protein